MEDKHQLASGGKPLENDERGTAHGAFCSPAPPINGSADQAGLTEQPITPAPHRRIASSQDSNECRECLAAMAHRLAQPMTALRGGMELILMGRRTVADYRAVLEQSMHLADDMAQLIVSLRDLGESGAPSGATQCILLEEATSTVMAEMESLAQSRDLLLQLHTDTNSKICANPERLREALQSLLAWVIQNSAGGGSIALELSAAVGEARLTLSPPRLDLQYLQIKVLEDITNPGLLFSHAAKNGALGWAINQRLLDGLGGKLEILADAHGAGCIRVRFPLAPELALGNPS
jgi:signal transduction histidine kinase